MNADVMTESSVIERATALANRGALAAAAKFLEEHAGQYAASPNFHLEAGKLLQDAGALHLAVPFLATTVSLKRTSASVDRLFVCQLRLGRYADAVQTLLVAVQTGYRTALRRDFATVVRWLSPSELKPADLDTLIAKFATDIMVGPGLLPHLVAADRASNIEAIAANDAIDARSWDEDLVLQTAAYLEQRGKPELALRILCRCGGHSDVFRQHVIRLLDRHSVAALKSVVLPLLAVPQGRYSAVVSAEPYFEIMERFARASDVDGIFETLIRLKDAMDPATAGEFYRRYAKRMAPLLGLVAAGRGDSDLDRLASLVAFWVDLPVRRFFAGPGLENLIALFTAPPLSDAPAGSRRATLRDKYFRHHLDRREAAPYPASPEDLEVGIFAARYFRSLGVFPADAIPLPPGMEERLRRPALSLGASKSIDVLTASLLGAVGIPANAEAADDAFLWHYAGGAVADSNVPSAFIADWVIAKMNVVDIRHDPPGINVTRFLRLLHGNAEVYAERYDLGAPPESLLFFLELVANWLYRHPQYRPFFAAMVPAEGSREHDFFRRCVAALAGEENADRFLRALAGHGTSTPISVAAPDDGKSYVLLVGHATKGTGLTRNFRMLHQALTASTGDGIVIEVLDYNSRANEWPVTLRRWREGAGKRPVVLYAINAEDVPLAMLKDVNGALADVYQIGFFLWEMSRVPPAQSLGIELVDEVWSPTQYVSGIYSPLARTHLVGKGLYDPATAPQPRAPRARFRFVTTFDFDSSIERKNPLAVVLAFQKAFTKGEDVELVIKGSAVKPDHWSNGLGHWERLSAAVADDRRVRLITTRLSDAEMDALVRGASCMVSLHRAEGFAFFLSDALAAGTPVIATDYSGNTDYCTPDNSFPVTYRLIPVDPRVAPWEAPGAEWAEPDIDSAAAQMRAVFERPEDALAKAALGREAVLSKYALEPFRRALVARIKAIRAAP